MRGWTGLTAGLRKGGKVVDPLPESLGYLEGHGCAVGEDGEGSEESGMRCYIM